MQTAVIPFRRMGSSYRIRRRKLTENKAARALAPWGSFFWRNYGFRDEQRGNAGKAAGETVTPDPHGSMAAAGYRAGHSSLSQERYRQKGL